MLSEEWESRIAQALTDSGGPPELALQLLALSVKYGLEHTDLMNWIQFHIGPDWAGSQFEQWAFKLVETREKLSILEGKRNAGK